VVTRPDTGLLPRFIGGAAGGGGGAGGAGAGGGEDEDDSGPVLFVRGNRLGATGGGAREPPNEDAVLEKLDAAPDTSFPKRELASVGSSGGFDCVQ
jgi:hypothetical protein